MIRSFFTTAPQPRTSGLGAGLSAEDDDRVPAFQKAWKDGATFEDMFGPSPFSLHGTVGGSGADNHRPDVAKVETFLGDAGYYKPMTNDGPAGWHNTNLDTAIKSFQKDHGLKVDGLLKPNGPTIGKLGGVLGGGAQPQAKPASIMPMPGDPDYHPIGGVTPPKANPWGSAESADRWEAGNMAKVLLGRSDYQDAVKHFAGEFARAPDTAKPYTAAVYDEMAKANPKQAIQFASQMKAAGLAPKPVEKPSADPPPPLSVEAPLAGQAPGTPLPPHEASPPKEKTAWDNFRYYAGPHLAESVERAGDAAKAMLQWTSPGADMQDAVDQSTEAADAARKGDWTGAVAKTGGAAASLGGLFIPGTVKGWKAGAETVVETAGDAIRRGLPDVSRTENPISAKEFAELADTGTIDPKRIRTMQEGISSNFRDRRSLEDTVEGLRSGKIKPEDIPPVRIGEVNGEIYTLDHRRLVAFREAGVPIRYEKVGAQTAREEAHQKMDTKDAGLSIRKRKGK